MASDLSELHFANAETPIQVSFESGGKTTLVRLSQWSKQDAPIATNAEPGENEIE
jgi:hypothetical protein